MIDIVPDKKNPRRFAYSRDPSFITGAGPYRIEEWDTGQTITLTRKKNHWSQHASDPYKRSYPDKIVFVINKDPNSQLLEFKSQTYDASTSLSNSTLIKLQKDLKFNANYNSSFTDTYSYSYVAMNMKPDGVSHKEIFTDKKVRQAMAMLFPLDQLNKMINYGKNKRINGPVSPLRPEYNHTLPLVQFDIEKAKLILDEAGWKDTDGDNIRDKQINGKKIKLEFKIDCFASNINFIRIITENMYKAGVKAEPNPLSFSVIYDHARNHNFDMLYGIWVKGDKPDDFTQVWHSSSWTSKGLNYTGFGNHLSDALIDSIKYTLDTAARVPMVKRLQKIIYDEQPYVFLFASMRCDVIHKRFGNQQLHFVQPGILLNNLHLLNSIVSINGTD